MNPSTRTPEGESNRCPICGKQVVVEPSRPADDAPCPHCGCLLWFDRANGLKRVYGFPAFSISDGSICTKVQAIEAILVRLVKSGLLDDRHRQGVLTAILKREELGS